MKASYLFSGVEFNCKQPHRAPHHVIQAITSKGLAQRSLHGRGGVKPATFCTEGIEHRHSANHAPLLAFLVRLLGSNVFYTCLLSISVSLVHNYRNLA